MDTSTIKKDLMRCPICESTDKWKNVDEMRLTKKGMCICQTCGFVSYPSLYKTEADIKAYYKKEYRKGPQVGNLYTGLRKLNYHETFLGPLFQEWTKAGRTTPVIFECGSAYGVFLNWIRTKVFPKAELYGTELTQSYKRVAWQEYKLKLDDDFDSSKQYDLICTYKVHEHVMDPDLKLQEYYKALKDDGLLYISVPLWFKDLNNFGKEDESFDIEYYYDTNHINVWSQNLFEQLLKKCGFEIVKYDQFLYGDTYLCKKGAPSTDLKFDDVNKNIELMKQIKEASLAYMTGDFKKAISYYSNFPIAYAQLYEHTRGKFHKEGFEVTFEMVYDEYLKPMFDGCNTSVKPWQHAADLASRYERYDKAIDYLNKCLELRPNGSVFLMMMSHVFRQMAIREKDPANKVKLYTNARDICRHITKIDLQFAPEALNWIYSDEAELSTPFEK